MPECQFPSKALTGKCAASPPYLPLQLLQAYQVASTLVEGEGREKLHSMQTMMMYNQRNAHEVYMRGK